MMHAWVSGKLWVSKGAGHALQYAAAVQQHASAEPLLRYNIGHQIGRGLVQQSGHYVEKPGFMISDQLHDKFILDYAVKFAEKTCHSAK